MAYLTSIAFDNSIWEIFAPLLNGGTLVRINPSTVLDSTALGEVFTREGVQLTMLTPALLKQYLNGNPDVLAVLEIMCIQGEKADVEDMLKARQLSGGTVINAYGPTENTVTSTFFVLIDEESYTNGVPIGRALSSSSALVMDRNK
jgi:non-ribosomal peptide synthetase component F